MTCFSVKEDPYNRKLPKFLQCSVQPKTVFSDSKLFLQTTEGIFCLLDLMPAFYFIFFADVNSEFKYVHKLSVYFTITKELSYKD